MDAILTQASGAFKLLAETLSALTSIFQVVTHTAEAIVMDHRDLETFLDTY